MDQKSFEEGLKLGIASARLVVERAKSFPHALAEVRRFEAETKNSIDHRRNGYKHKNRPAETGDIFCAVPIAHPGDFGFPAADSDDAAAALSRVGLRRAIRALSNA